MAQMAMIGVADGFLTSQPEITFFKLVTKRHTNFSLESIEQQFTGPVDFGSRASCGISRNGDLAWTAWVQVTLPDLAAYGIANLKWCDSVAHALLASVELEIGGSRIDRHVPVWMDCWSELSEKEEKRAAFATMVGKYGRAYNPASAASDGGRRTFYVPLQFYFCRSPGQALPLVALNFSDVKLNFEFAPYTQLIRCTTPVGVLSPAPTLVDCKLFVDYVFLDVAERNRFVATKHEYVVDVVQAQGDEAVYQTGVAGTVNRKVTLNFTHPVKELVWVYSPYANYQTDAVTGNRLTDYDIPDHDVLLPNGDTVAASSLVADLAAVDPVTSAKLVINGTDRMAERPGSYFRLVQPYQHHTRCPSKHVYSYSFALYPEDSAPSGACNFTRIDSATLNLTMDPLVTSGKVLVFARSHNVIRVAEGQAGLAFTS